jgi:hypothetical protein
MSTVPEMTWVGAGPVTTVSEPRHELVLQDGTSVDVLSSYRVRIEADLYSLSAPIEFSCAACRHPCEATLVAVRQGWLLCPSCYAAPEPVREPPESQQPTAA